MTRVKTTRESGRLSQIDENRLIGTLNGDVLFGEYTFHLSAQSRQMVGVEKEEHLKTSWKRSLRLGADPTTASSIFLTTSTDVASMGMFLWLATVLIL